MASFLDMDEDRRRLYIARMLGLSPDHPDSWPMDMIDQMIERAEKKADRSVRNDVWSLTQRIS